MLCKVRFIGHDVCDNLVIESVCCQSEVQIFETKSKKEVSKNISLLQCHQQQKGSVFHYLTNSKNIFNPIDNPQIDVSVIRKGELQNG